MNNEREIAKQLFDERFMFKDNPIAWTAWKMAFQLGIEHQQKLHKPDVLSCKKLLVQKSMDIQQQIAKAQNWIIDEDLRRKNKAIEIVLEMIHEPTAL